MDNKKRFISSVILFLIIINFISSLLFIDYKVAADYDGWKKGYYDFLLDYEKRVRLDNQRDNLELVEVPIDENYKYINELGSEVWADEKDDLYNGLEAFISTECIKLLHITDDVVPNLIISSFQGLYDTRGVYATTKIYEFKDGQVKEVETENAISNIFYKETENGLDVLNTFFEIDSIYYRLNWDEKNRKITEKPVNEAEPRPMPIVENELLNKGYEPVYKSDDVKMDKAFKVLIDYDEDTKSKVEYLYAFTGEKNIRKFLDSYIDPKIDIKLNKEEIKILEGSRGYLDFDVNVEDVNIDYIVEDEEILEVTSLGEIIGLKPGDTNVKVNISKKGYQGNEIIIPVKVKKSLEIEYDKIVLGDNEENIEYLKNLLETSDDIYFQDNNALLDIVDLSNLIIKNASINSLKAKNNIVYIDEKSLVTSYENIDEVSKKTKNIVNAKGFSIPKDIVNEVLLIGNNVDLNKGVTLNLDKSIMNMNSLIDYINVELGELDLTFRMKDLEKEFRNKNDFQIKIKKSDEGYVFEYFQDNKLIDVLNRNFQIAIPIKVEEDYDYYSVCLKEDNDIEKIGGRYEPELEKIKCGIKTGGEYIVSKDEVKLNDIDDLDLHIKNSIKYMTSKGFIELKEDNKFAPNDKITRNEFTQLIVKSLYELDKSLETTFKDVNSNDEYYEYIASSEKEEIVKGYDDNTFRGKNTINREEVIAIASRVLNDKGDYLYPSENELDNFLPFNDVEDISEWAKKEIALAYRNDLIGVSGDKNFNAKEDITRAEATDIIYRLFELLNRPSPAKISVSNNISENNNLPVLISMGVIFTGGILFLLYKNKKA